jgi:hypothetical protein
VKHYPQQVDLAKDALVDAVMYALREGCFFPVPQPRSPYRVRDLIKWGAMRNLHTKIAEYDRLLASPGGGSTPAQEEEEE